VSKKIKIEATFERLEKEAMFLHSSLATIKDGEKVVLKIHQNLHNNTFIFHKDKERYALDLYALAEAFIKKTKQKTRKNIGK